MVFYEWVKLRDFNCIISLLVFPEQKQIGFILGAMAMKEEHVLVDNRISESLCLPFW